MPWDMRAERVTEAGLFTLAVAPHVALFSAAFALAGVVVAESRGLRGWSYYVLVGIGIAVAGFLTQHLSEAPGQATILQNYALIAFVAAGLAGGLVYWFFSGRYARPRALASRT
jgi:hypothetical protein